MHAIAIHGGAGAVPRASLSAQREQRFRAGLERILRRHRGQAIALVLRPMAMQVCAGLLRGEDLQTIAGHLHERTPVESIDVPDDIPRPRGESGD